MKKKYYKKKNYFTIISIIFLLGFLFFTKLKVTMISLKEHFLFIIILFVGFLFCIIFIKILFKKYLKRKTKMKYLNSPISKVDIMEGIEFEHFLKHHFEALGYNVKETNATNDYGADLLLKSFNKIIVVQAKRYKANVGIKAIQEICAAVPYFKATKGIVVTNSHFTKNAIQLAKANNIELIDREKLSIIMNSHKLIESANNIIKVTSVNKVCPLCKHTLKIINGKYGKFLGCSNYPKCTFKRKMNL